MAELTLYKKFNTGTLPFFSAEFFVIIDELGWVAYDLNSNVVAKSKEDENIKLFHNNTLYVSNGNGVLAYNIANNSLNKIHLDYFQGVALEDYFLITKLSENKVSLYSFERDRIIWSKVHKDSERLVDYHLDQDSFFCTNKSRTKKYSFELKSGNAKWNLDANELQLPTEVSTLGNSYLVGNSLIGHSENRHWFGLNKNNKNLLWSTKLPAKTLGGNLYKGDFHSINIYEFEKSGPQAFGYINLSLETGNIKMEVDISKNLESLNVIKERYGLYDYFGSPAIGETHLFFTVENHLLSLDLFTTEIEKVYTHDHKLMFSKIFNRKIFITDDSASLLVLEGPSLAHDVIGELNM